MSGIYGMVRYDGAPVTPETLAPMAEAMSFWGPDGHGQWCGDAAGLGHLMLHVTPESLHERLPASIRVAPHLVITADARIDNRDELFDALGVAGPGRGQTPDSSLILLAYERWGPDCVKRLLGDFAFAIWDSRERKLFCARDCFGCKPFVYHHDGKRFIFGSDVKGVLARVESPRLNEPLLATYLQTRTYHAEKRFTFFQEIVKIPPAHMLAVSAAGAQLSRYWSPDDVPEVRLAIDADYSEQMRLLLEQSVECRLRSAFPIGSHLSGGLDSSTVTIMAGRLLRARGRQLEAFSWSPPPSPDSNPDPDSEHMRIGSVCQQEGLVCRYVPPARARLMDSFQRDISTEPDAMLMREADVQTIAEKLGLRVMLSGWGGDEAVSAHTSSYLAEFFMDGRWPELRNAVKLHIAAGGPGALRQVWRLKGIVRELIVPRLPDSVYVLAHKNAFQNHKSCCIRPEFARRYREEVEELWGPTWRQLPRVRETICRLLEIGNIPRRLEHWAGSGARHRLVYRYPMLDRRLVEFILGIPVTQFCGPELRRSVFRRAIGPLLPASGTWMRVKREPSMLGAIGRDHFEAHREWAHHLTSDMAGSPASQFVDPARINGAIAAHRDSDKLAVLTGIREAFQCYAIKAVQL